MTPRAVVIRAKRLLDEGRYEEAIDGLEAHLEDHEDKAVLNMLGHAYFRFGDYDAAEEVYRELVATPDPDPRDLVSLGNTLKMKGSRKAHVWLEAAAARDPRLVSPRRKERPPTPPPREIPPSSEEPVVPISELGIPRTKEELEKFTELLRARSKEDWKTENWYRFPWAVRIFQIILFVIFIAIWVSLLSAWPGQ